MVYQMAVEVLDNSRTKQFDFEKRGQRSIKQGFQTNPPLHIIHLVDVEEALQTLFHHGHQTAKLSIEG